jgi:hypothetical protein
MFRHCIINTTTNLVENIVKYNKIKTGVPLGFSNDYICVASEDAQMGATYNQDGTFTNPPVEEGIDILNLELPLASPLDI